VRKISWPGKHPSHTQTEQCTTRVRSSPARGGRALRTGDEEASSRAERLHSRPPSATIDDDGSPPVVVNEPADPRTYLAAERTFLAWIRTGISLIAFGFVIEKFDFFLRKLTVLLHTPSPAHTNFSGLGLAFILLGLATLIVGGASYLGTIRRLGRGEYRPRTTLLLVYGAVLLTTTVVLVITIAGVRS
jgi:uncharacterized membrane protein YidH (DUF202 family)